MIDLNKQADRVSVMLEIIDSMKNPNKPGAITAAELETFVSNDIDRRNRYAPCMAEGVPFHTTIAAAHYVAHVRPDLWVDTDAARRMDAHAVMENIRNRVRRWCMADDVVGYYWI